MRRVLPSLFSCAILLGFVGLIDHPIVALAGPYAAIGDIPIGGAGAFDYLNVDPAANRLYVSHGTEVVVIDTTTNRVVGRLSDTPGVHGIAPAPDLGKIFTTNGRENMVGVFDIKTLAPVTKIDAGGANPDAVWYDAVTKRVWAFNHTGKSATAIDAITNRPVVTIPLSGTAESGVADPGLKRVFVNIEDKSAIDVIDTTTNKVVATWPVAPGEEPTGLTIDTTTHRLFVGAGGFMLMMDASSGKVLAQVPICEGTDATWFDPGTQLAMSSCGDGHITIAHVDSGTKLSIVQTLETTRGARTMTLDTKTHRLYTAAQRYAAGPPPAGARGPAAVPESFHVLVYGQSQ